MFLPKIFSVLREGYSLEDLRRDLQAGLTVAIVALPLSMAFGIASSASPEQGLITAIVGGFLISFLGGSRVQIGGPTGAFVVLVASIIGRFGYEGLLFATILAGLILVIAGYAKLGRLMKFIPKSVVIGFTSGIAVVIASTQVKDFLGLQIDQVPSDFIPKWGAIFSSLGTTNPAALGVGILSLSAIYLLKRFFPKLPRYLIALLVAALVVQVAGLQVETIGSRFAGLSFSLPVPKWPSFPLDQIEEILPSAFTIAFLAGVEALLSAVVADGMTGYKHRSNQELVGQGIANISSALLGGLPATGAIARTATNIMAGGKTPFAGIFHSLFLFLFILFASDSMKYIPMTSLSAVLFFVAWGMSEVHQFARTWKFAGSDRAVLVLTFLLTVFVDLPVAIAVGVTLASLLFVAKMSRSVEISSEFEVEDEEINQRIELPQGVEVFRIAGPIFFGIAEEIPDLLQRVGDAPRILIIRMRWVPFLDKSGAGALSDLVKKCSERQTQVIFSALQEQPKEALSRIHQREKWANVLYAPSYEEAIRLASEN